MQRISKFSACGRYFDMSLLTRSRRQRYSKILKLQNNLKRKLENRSDKKLPKKPPMNIDAIEINAGLLHGIYSRPAQTFISKLLTFL